MSVRWIMSKLPYNWLKNIDFAVHRLHDPLFGAIRDELNRRKAAEKDKNDDS